MGQNYPFFLPYKNQTKKNSTIRVVWKSLSVWAQNLPSTLWSYKMTKYSNRKNINVIWAYTTSSHTCTCMYIIKLPAAISSRCHLSKWASKVQSHNWITGEQSNDSQKRSCFVAASFPYSLSEFCKFLFLLGSPLSHHSGSTGRRPMWFRRCSFFGSWILPIRIVTVNDETPPQLSWLWRLNFIVIISISPIIILWFFVIVINDTIAEHAAVGLTACCRVRLQERYRWVSGGLSLKANIEEIIALLAGLPLQWLIYKWAQLIGLRQ